MSEDLVAVWNIALADGCFKIEFEHGTTSGRRVIRINGNVLTEIHFPCLFLSRQLQLICVCACVLLQEIMRENWMFKLVGKESFEIGKHKCVITIESTSGLNYAYSLEVDGKSFEKFSENQSKVLQAWVFSVAGQQHRLVLEKQTLDIWLDGNRLDIEV